MTKFGGTKVGVPPKETVKIQTFYHSRWTHEIFGVGKYEKSSPQTGPSEIQTFQPIMLGT